MKTEFINEQQLLEILVKQKGATFATIVAETEPKVKKDCPYKPVKKLTRVNVTINGNYESMVNRQRARENKETDFQSMPRAWGERLSGTPIITHKGNYYLSAKPEKYFESQFFHNGKPVDENNIKPYFYAKSAGRQGTEKEVKERDFKFSSIRELVINKCKYELVH